MIDIPVLNTHCTWVGRMEYGDIGSYDGSGLEIFKDEINDKEVGELSFT